MNIVFKGSGTHIIDTLCFSVECGDVYVIPPNVPHAYINTEKLDVYHILIRPEFVKEHFRSARDVSGFVSFFEIEPFLRQRFEKNMFLHLTPSEMVTLKNEIVFIEQDGGFDDDATLPIKNHSTIKLIYWLSYLHKKQLEEGGKTEKYQKEIVTLLEYIHINYMDKITIENMCRITYLSRSTLLRSFFKICKCTPSEYLLRYRCQRAQELLETGEFTKTQVANICGFYDASHMLKNIDF